MKRFGGWDTGLGVLLTVGAVGMAAWAPPFTENIENKLYDLRLKALPTLAPSDDIRLVAIDAPSIEALGRWPWPRSVMAQLVSRVAEGEPRALACAVIFSEPDENQGLTALRELREEYQVLLEEEGAALKPLWKRLATDPRYKRFVRDPPLGDLRGFGETMDEALGDLDNDAKLVEAFGKSRRDLLAFYFQAKGQEGGEEPAETVEQLKDAGFLQAQVKGEGTAKLPEGAMPLLPLSSLIQEAGGLGHTTVLQDPDGAVRRDAPVMRFRGQYVPSLPLQMARVAMNVPMKDVEIYPGKEIVLGKRRIPLDEGSRMLIKFPGTFENFKKHSAVDVLRDTGGTPPRTFKDKLVLVGMTDAGLGSSFVTPVDSAYQFNGLLLASLRNIWEGSFLSRPRWAPRVEWGALAVIGLFVSLLLPRLRGRVALGTSLGLLLLILGVGTYLFLAKNLWIKIFYPMALLFLGWLVLTVRRFFFSEDRRELVEAQTHETNKNLGLSYQSQGLLDMAFEKFRKCPVHDDIKSVLYNLALDFERKRQFGKAAVVYDHIYAVDPAFRDVTERGKRAKQASETGGLSAGLAGKAGGTVVFGANAAKPTLGRYEIEKELGRGAMGVVYLGRDPKINRQVAVKTLRFDDDADAETAKTIRERFFREAESAGTLNHPHIIRIFDAGEDAEISFIAMELLEGDDLKKVVEKENLLPVPQVIDYVATIADALDYAHAHGVVHRDIKPANVMRLKDGTLRVTDFGIARIAASSKTVTGTVLGTPSYMSPEQLSGKKIDGRSDLFSLGVMLYEMLVGEKPFVGESIATLLFKIASEAHPNPRLKRPDRITAPLTAIIDRAMAKDPDQRYQRGADMARDLRAIPASPAAPPPAAAPLSPDDTHPILKAIELARETLPPSPEGPSV